LLPTSKPLEDELAHGLRLGSGEDEIRVSDPQRLRNRGPSDQ